MNIRVLFFNLYEKIGMIFYKNMAHDPKFIKPSFQPSVPDYLNLSEQERKGYLKEKIAVQKEIKEKLKNVVDIKFKVEVVANMLDKYGFDVLFSSAIPILGDAGVSMLAGIYLIYEAKQAGLTKTSYLKIIGLQALDFFAGVVPVADNVTDYLSKANIWSAKEFEKKTEQLVAEARKAGVPEEDIKKITVPAEKLPKLIDRAVGFYKKFKS